MISTGRFNKFTEQEILQAEETDVNWTKAWEDLTLEEKANFCSYARIPLLNKDIEDIVATLYRKLKLNETSRKRYSSEKLLELSIEKAQRDYKKLQESPPIKEERLDQVRETLNGLKLLYNSTYGSLPQNLQD